MSLHKDKYANIPKDAVVLSESEALQYQMKVLKNWKHTKDVFAYKTGAWFLGGSCFVTGLFVNSYYRKKFKLLHYGRASSYLPICVLPTIVAVIAHVEFILKDVVLQKQQQCPLCIEIRASALQAFVGCLFPTILGPVSALSLAHSYGTYNVPYITQEPRKVYELIKHVSKPISRPLFYIFLGQALFGSIVTYFENESVYKVNIKLDLLEETLAAQ